MPSSRGSSQSRDRTLVSHIAGGFFTVWATREAQEYWSCLPCPPPGNLSDTGIEPTSLVSCVGRWVFGFFFFTTSATWEAQFLFWALYKSKLWASLFKSEMNKFAFTVYNNYWFIVSIVRQILFLNSCWLCHLLSMYPLSVGILQARILEGLAMPSSRGIFPTQGSNSGLPYCTWILSLLNYQRSTRILEWVA